MFLRWAGPRPHIPIPPDLIFLYVNLIAMGPAHLSPVTWPQSLRYWYSLTPLMHIVTQLRPIDLHNFLGQIPESSQFWVPVNCPSLNELVSMPGLWRIPTQFRLPPNAINLQLLFPISWDTRHGSTRGSGHVLLRTVAHDTVLCRFSNRSDPDPDKWCGPSGQAAWTVHRVKNHTLLGPPLPIRVGRRVGPAL